MNYSAYPGYKDSRIEWLGEIPEEWSHSKLGFESIVKARLGWKGLKADEYIASGYIFLATPNIKGNDIDFDNVNYITKERYEESPEIMLQLGDILVTKDGSTVGTTNVVRYLPEAATVNSSIAVVRPFQTLDSIYLYYFLSSSYVQNVIQRMKGGMGVPHLFQEDLRKFSIILPSLSEQTAIANFLDHETAKIDTLIAKQQRLIELLQEKRQALISHAVTKGLNPDAPMKDSGIEWLGEIPAHWKVSPLKHLATVRTGVAKGRDLTGQDTIEVPYLRVANVQDGYLDLSDVALITIARHELERYSLQNRDVLMNEGGDNDKLGRGHVWRGEIEPCIHQNHVFAVRPKEIDSEWLNFITGTDYAKFYFYSFAKQSTNLASISSRSLQELPVICPPIQERNQILEYVKNETERIDSLTDKSRRAVNLFQERRSSLISAAVTGKIDVRGHV